MKISAVPANSPVEPQSTSIADRYRYIPRKEWEKIKREQEGRPVVNGSIMPPKRIGPPK
jgi:hypothetical protein